MKKQTLIWALMCVFLALFPSRAFPFEGPLQVKNQFPLFLSLNAPYLERAAYEDSFSATFSYSSVFMVKNSPEWSVNLDMEVAELNLRLRKNICDVLQLGIDIPLLSFNSGFMDNFLSSYHNAFGFSDYGRSSRPSNEFLYEVRKNGILIIQGEGGGIGIGDIRLSAKRALLNNDPVVSLQAAIELPTGNASKGYGNGSVDAGISLLMDKKISEKMKAYLNLGIIFPGNLKGKETVTLKNSIYGGAAVEAGLWEHISLLGQVVFQNSPFPKTG
ncbi:MAG TPA: DUF3187 family protein, partial [Thermodesulfovibrionales bacterium]|nr:DUF3187 family protein [Thermodesulfovibrionales bacterium]